ncbi:MAG: ATP-binding protein [Persicimonas sp.]
MTASLQRIYKVLVLGDVWEVDDIFARPLFRERFPVEVVYVDDAEKFRDAVEGPEFDLIIIDVEPHGIELVDHLAEHPPMRPMIMVGDPDQAGIILEAKDKGLQRYVIRLDDDQINIDLLYQEIKSVFEQLTQPDVNDARRQVEEKLERRQKALWSYFDTVPLPLQVVHEELSIERCNPAFLQLLGQDTAEHIEGHPVGDFIHPEDQDDVRDALELLMSGEEAYFQAEHRYCDEDGLVVWVNHICFSIDDRVGRPERVLLIAVDVTRQKEAEQRAEQSMRMEAIGELAGGIAHDFNNILAIVATLGHVLKEKLSAKHEHELVEHVDKMEHAIESGASLTHQLLSFSQKRSSEPELFELNRRIRETRDLFDRALGEDIDMHLHLADDLAPIEVGKGQFDQVSMNLLVNARDAMPDGGTLNVRTRQIHIEPHEPPPRPDLEPGDWVVVEIADTGVGMDRETQKRIFDPFYTTKGPGEGTGMGLATVYRIIEANDGKIYVDSTPGQGSTFTIYLPASARTTEAESGEEDSERLEAATKPTPGCILLVEDEEDIREPYALFLRDQGYHVLEAASLEQARAAVERADRPIDLLLADVILPDGSGVDLAKQLRDELSGMDVIFVSGYAPDLIYRGERGLDEQWGFLPKPVSRDKLLSTVGDALPQKD